MKWTSISKAKVKFGQLYLVAVKDQNPKVGKLCKSQETEKDGIQHLFNCGKDPGAEVAPISDLVTATHVAIITDPNADA